MAKALHLPLDTRIVTLPDVPYTISYVIRKRLQLDNIYELPKEKQPSEHLLWDGTTEELDAWFKRVLNDKKEKFTTEIVFSDSEIER